ncbi:MAG TPA: TOMM precursor leader peptide-binding protein [Streptosporangiaceae bacterium]|nr:TOMM precursor leader peptide-binding protein [Streptosporangiaceae bacterium]
MAAAVRLEVAVHPVGSFGREVAGRIQSFASGTTILPSREQCLRPRPGSLIIVAMYHEDEALCDAVDEAAYETRTPWLPVFMDHPFLQAGPLIGPGRPGCYRCFRARRAQHERHAKLLNELRNERGKKCPEAFFPHHAAIAAGLAWKLAEEPDPMSTVLAWHVGSGLGYTARVIACHRCSRCHRPGGDG